MQVSERPGSGASFLRVRRLACKLPLLLLLAALPTGAALTQDVPCSKSAGVRRAAEYVRQCRDVSPATHPPCNAENACELIISEIKRSCALIGADAPKFCAEYAGKR
jgi:hypothetical protein